MDILCRDPPTESATDRGFYCVFNHPKVVNDDLHFQYKIHGIEMEAFKPKFVSAPDVAGDNDLANLGTWRWQPQAALLSQNLGMVSVDLEKYIVGSAEAGVDVVKNLLNQKLPKYRYVFGNFET